MARQERTAPGKYCPRGCGRKIKAGREGAYNAVSTVDRLQVCPDCYVEELIARAREDRVE